HRTGVEEIHFHEVGAVDAIVDIVGAVSGLWRLGIEEVYASPVHTGTGFVNCAHGIIPVPAPATVELLKGVPVYSQGIESELATPTGAAILTSYCRHFGQMPPMRLLSCGYGAGERDLSIPNLLRLQVGEKIEGVSGGTLRLVGRGEIGQEEVLLLEANIDDMNPEFYDYLIDIFLEAGAMEVFFHPIQMKKNRPGVLLKLLIKSWQLEEFARLLLAETSSIGLRAYPATKLMLPYEIISIETELGTARVKVATSGDRIRNISPEYEDCRKIARERKKPLKEVYDLIKGEANRFLQTKDRP
ncbi:MAG TPA: nickel pincer cofactor biosynthesis protein LarC, partial [Clostridia bacterium]|nr:nickel pincer cofactor biosynthesis protein LarC [Clostridia bacterium]